jgi:RNA polymerase sigma-70 factor (ECF subfamily)
MSKRGFFRPRLVSTASGRLAADDRARAEMRASQFRLIMLPQMDAAYSFARYLARDASIAEDVVQEAFLRAFRAFDSWRGDNPKSWLLSIVRNCYVDTIRARDPALFGADHVDAFDEQVGDRDAPDNCSPEDIVAARGEAAMLRRTIENLPEPFRETLVLRELEELSYKEIAAISNVPIGTVMSRLARAREMLAALLLPPTGQSREARS